MVGKLGALSNVAKSELGGKAYSLDRLIESNIDVPSGIVIFSSFFFEYLRSNDIYDRISSLCQNLTLDNVTPSSESLKNLVMNGEIDKDKINSIYSNIIDLDKFVSVRSSAASEDSEQYTFAGLHDTFLNISQPENLFDSIKQCWASLFNERALVYRIKKKIPIFEGIAVVVQNMVQAECSGVVYTRHPVEREFILVEASFGIGDSVVDGVVRPDSYIIDRNTRAIIRKDIGTKKIKTGLKNGIHIVEKNKGMDSFSLDDVTLNELVLSCLNIENIFTKTQDIEWAYDGRLWFLQSRTVSF